MDEPILLCDLNICRLCAERNDNGIHIFETDENSSNLQQLINKYLPIVVEKDDIFPKIICPGCHIQLEATKLFMDLIVNGQSRLRELYKKQEKQAKIAQLEADYLNNLSNSSLYLAEHGLKLLAEGLDRPKRKRGRPAKKVVHEDKQENLEYAEAANVENCEDEKSEDEIGTDGRKKRKIRAPARFDGLVQGKELEDILIKEGVLDDVKDVSKTRDQFKTYTELIIGRTESEYGKDLGRPIFVKQKSKIVNFKKDQIKKYECQICSKIFIHEMSFNLHMKSHEIEIINEDLLETEESEVRSDEQVSKESITLTEAINITDIPTIEDTQDSSMEHSNTLTDTNGSTQEPLTLHLKEQNGKQKYTCDICNKVLRHSSTLLYHKETEHNNQRFVCNKCDRSFKHRQLLQRHQIVHTQDRPFVCSICNATFKTQGNLINHKAVHTKEKPYKCTQCNQKFSHRTSLSLHQRWHEGKKPYTCEFCQKRFSQNGNLLEHKRIHTGEKPFFCEICGTYFTTSSQLRIHVKRHTGEKPWKCEICEKSFLHRDTYKLHVRRHLNYRPHVCPICNKAFTERWALKKHQAVHTGEKPYKCEHCQKAFADKSNLLKHNKIQKCRNNNHKLDVNAITKASSSSFQLTQLVDQQGNPIRIITQDGQTFPIVTSGDDVTNIQGLMPDGSLIPIEISAMEEQDFNEGISQSSTLDLLETSTTDELILEDTLGSAIQNFQLLTNNDGEEVCLVTYSIEDDGALTQELVLE
ncbi:unnamed protein product [Psylliodes chrysocephalus]|uniref:Uncharacterized protein n=1 Tax=Psylliodes chrysocephalus TaxID=3402493 RepID=A0A9P0CS97_9CUCU|nr:unnamed protein product [Psylliodes chrysocephala]